MDVSARSPAETASEAEAAPGAPSPWAYALLATVPLNWGFNFISLKVLKQDFSVIGLLSARYVLMVIALFVTLWAFEREVAIRREHLRYFIGFAFVTVFIYQMCFAAGVFYTLAAESALLISTAPIWAAIMNHFLGWERLSRRQAVGTLLGFGGTAGVILGGLGARNVPEHHLFGLAIMVVAGILWACYAVFSRPLLRHYSPLKVTAWLHLIGAVGLIPLGAKHALAVDWFNLSWLTWLCYFHFSLLAGVYGFVVWYRGVATIGSSRTVLFQYCVPIVATLLAYLLLHEEPTIVQVAGIVVTLAGLNLAVPASGGRRTADDGETGEEYEPAAAGSGE